ncbi:MAG: hypothetical protein ACK41D_09135 [Rubricoccaceae bacterium]
MRYPYERLVLGFGAALAAAAYVYWMAVGIRYSEPWAATAAMRAAFVLAGTLLMALVMRAAVYLNRKP